MICFNKSTMTIPKVVTNQSEIDTLVSSIGQNIICYPYGNTHENIIKLLNKIDGNIAHPTHDGQLLYCVESLYFISNILDV